MTFVGVCGGRGFADRDFMADMLEQEVLGDDVIVTGDATGADRLADEWARRNGNHVVRIPALWDQFGRSAGARRSAVIASMPLRLLIAFPGGNGTADMVRKARAAGIEVLEAKR